MASYNDDDLDRIFLTANGACHLCHNELDRDRYGAKGVGGWQVDHSVPLSKGGSDSWRNLRPACTGCNAEKGNMSTAAYRKQKGVEGMPPPMSDKLEHQLDDIIRDMKDWGINALGDNWPLDDEAVIEAATKRQKRRAKKELEQRRSAMKTKRDNAQFGAGALAGVVGFGAAVVLGDVVMGAIVAALVLVVLLIVVQQWYNPDKVI